MSRLLGGIAPDPVDNAPGLQYPSDINLDPSNPTGFALKNAYDNLFYLRRKVEGLKNQGKSLTARQIQALITTAVNRARLRTASAIVGTHAIRISTYAAASGVVGAEFYESDRTSYYIISDASGVKRWVFSSGSMSGAFATRPTDLEVYDAGFSFTDTTTDQETQYLWDGAEWVTIGGYLQEVSDAVTNTLTTARILRHLTSGASAAGFGIGDLFQLGGAGGATVSAARWSYEWADPAAGTEDTLAKLWLMLAGTLTEILSLTSTGLLTITGDYSWLSGTAFTGTLRHNNSGTNKLYDFLNSDGTVALAVSNILLPTQGAAIGSTVIIGTAAGTLFRVSYSLQTTTADGTAGTVQLTIAFTDDTGARTLLSAALALTALGGDQGSFFIQRASGSISYSTAIGGAIGTAIYSLYISCERMN